MRLKSADQSMITDVSRLRPHLCTIITSIAPAQIVAEDVELWRPSLTRDIRANCGLFDNLVCGGEGWTAHIALFVFVPD